MVLKRKILSYLIFLLSANFFIYSREAENSNIKKEDYVFHVVSQILKDSPHGIALANEESSMNLSFAQQDKYWLPSIQFDISANSDLVQGDFSYVKNMGIISDPQIIFSPSVNVGIVQNLPGNGKVSINAGYGISSLPSFNAYKQQPYLQIGLNQPLSYGTFFITKDPSIERINNQKNMARLEYQEALFELIINFVNTVQTYNLALLEKEYYSVMLKKIQAEYQEQDNRFSLGQESTVELFNLYMKKSETLQKFQQASLAVIQAKAVLETYKGDDITENSDLFRDGILSLLNERYDGVTQQTIQEIRILNQIEDVELSLKANESAFFPSLSMQLSLSPNENKNDSYVDFSRSLRDLVDSSRALSVNASIRIHVPLDYSSQLKTLKEASSIKNQNLTLQLEVLRDEQIKMRHLYDEWSVSFSEYCDYMEQALQTEEEFRVDIKSLLDNHIVTESEYWTTEVSYFETRLNYYRSIWNMIQGKINILRLSSGWIEFIQQFTGGEE